MAHIVVWRCWFQKPDLKLWNSNPKIIFCANLDRKSKKCPLYLKIGSHVISRMLIFIPTLIFWRSNPKFWIQCFAWKLGHRVSRGCWVLLRDCFSEIPSLNPIFSQIKVENIDLSALPGNWLSRGCDCNHTKEGLEVKTRMNNCIKCWWLLYFYHS